MALQEGPAPAEAKAEPESVTLVRIDWRDHVPILGAAVTFLFIVVEAYGVSDFDIPTALSLLESAGATHILLGTLLGFLPYVLPILLFAALWGAVRLRRRGADWGTQAVVWTVAAVAAALSAWRFALLTAVVLGVYTALVLAAARTAGRRGAAGSPAGPAAVVALGAFFLISLTTPWVPEETLRIEGHSVRAFRAGDGFVRHGSQLLGSAYVVAQGDGWVTLLAAHNRRAIRIPDADLAARQVCRRNTPVPRESVAQLLFARTPHSQTPRCPPASP